MIGRIIIGLLILGAGFICVWRTQWAIDLIGPIEFAEKTFTSGSWTFYKIVGVLVVILGAIVVAGLQDDLLNATLGSWLSF